MEIRVNILGIDKVCHICYSVSMKVALVTGSAQGIGRAIALNLAAHDYTVIVHYLSSQESAADVIEQVQKSAPNSMMLKTDLTDANAIRKMFETVHESYQKLDVLINTVGNFGEYRKLEEVDIDEFDDVMDTNVRATFLCTQAALPLLRSSNEGRVVNFSCASAEHTLARKFTVPYYIAKGGIITLTKSWAEDLADENITVNAISPGIVENSDNKQTVPMSRFATYDDITATVRYLLSSEASYISGANIEISGGWIPHHE